MSQPYPPCLQGVERETLGQLALAYGHAFREWDAYWKEYRQTHAEWTEEGQEYCYEDERARVLREAKEREELLLLHYAQHLAQRREPTFGDEPGEGP